jgi:hypothetical protein
MKKKKSQYQEIVAKTKEGARYGSCTKVAAVGSTWKSWGRVDARVLSAEWELWEL